MLNYPLTARQVFSESSTQEHPLGTLAMDHSGRRFRYARAGAVALVAGDVLQAAAQAANHQDLTPSAAAIGDVSLTVTLGATLVAADDYADGFAVIDTTPGLGYSYPIRGHAAAASGASLVVNLFRGWPVQVALTGTSRVSLYRNRFRGVIQSPVTTLTNIPVGVCVFPLTIAYYGWVGTGGEFGTLIQGTPGVGFAVGPPGSAAGAVAINSSTNPIVGYMMDTGQDGKVQGVNWILD